jgi:hypothetical protein
MSGSTSFTLRAFFNRDFAPTFLVGAAPRTFEAYADTLSAWERFTPNPALDAIDTRTLAEFKTTAAGELAAPTVNKHLRHVHHMLAKAGPPGYRNRDALGLLARAPWTKPLREIEPEPRLVTDDELAAFFAACPRARLPRLDGVHPSAWWITLASAALLLAARRGTLLGLKWANIDVAARLVRYSGSIDKNRRRREKPIHPALVPMLLAIRGPWERVFPWPHARRKYWEEFRRLQDLADVVEPRWHLHDLKKTALTSASASMDVFTLKAFGDHSTIRTTERFYATGRHRLAAAIDAMRIPPPLANQRLLF